MLDDSGESDCPIRIVNAPTQRLSPPNAAQRFEGIAFSSTGDTLGVAASDTDAVFLFRRNADGRFDDTPFWSITGTASGLNYPHDLCFSQSGESELLAVAQRTGAICIYEKTGETEGFSSVPVFQIKGWRTKLRFTDAVAFVPPENRYLAACNLSSSKVTFYRRQDGHVVRFRTSPVFLLKHTSVCEPDGLAFSDCGTWLAIANHGAHTVSVYARARQPRREAQYGPTPTTVLDDSSLRYPHSVAFTPRSHHLIVTNAGANYFNVYRREGAGWSQQPVMRKLVGPDSQFRHINARNKMEGGPKGIAIHGDKLAVCSPEHGIQIYSFTDVS